MMGIYLWDNFKSIAAVIGGKIVSQSLLTMLGVTTSLVLAASTVYVGTTPPKDGISRGFFGNIKEKIFSSTSRESLEDDYLEDQNEGSKDKSDALNPFYIHARYPAYVESLKLTIDQKKENEKVPSIKFLYILVIGKLEFSILENSRVLRIPASSYAKKNSSSARIDTYS